METVINWIIENINWIIIGIMVILMVLLWLVNRARKRHLKDIKIMFNYKQFYIDSKAKENVKRLEYEARGIKLRQDGILVFEDLKIKWYERVAFESHMYYHMVLLDDKAEPYDIYLDPTTMFDIEPKFAYSIEDLAYNQSLIEENGQRTELLNAFMFLFQDRKKFRDPNIRVEQGSNEVRFKNRLLIRCYEHTIYNGSSFYRLNVHFMQSKSPDLAGKSSSADNFFDVFVPVRSWHQNQQDSPPSVKDPIVFFMSNSDLLDPKTAAYHQSCFLFVEESKLVWEVCQILFNPIIN